MFKTMYVYFLSIKSKFVDTAYKFDPTYKVCAP